MWDRIETEGRIVRRSGSRGRSVDFDKLLRLKGVSSPGDTKYRGKQRNEDS